MNPARIAAMPAPTAAPRAWRILHLSDPHFGTERPPVAQALLALAQHARPDVLVLSGDVTQRARPREFAAAQAWLRRMAEVAGIDTRRDVLVLPGNHDLPLILTFWRRLGDPWRAWRAAFGDELEPRLERPGLLLLGVNTTRRWRHKHGAISRAQIRRLTTALRGAPPGTLRVVVTHQPLYVIEADDRRDLLRGHAHATRALADAGADLLLAGHIHQSFVASLPAGTGTRGSQPAAHGPWAVQAGTAVSRRVREQVPNSVHLIVSTPERADTRCEVQRWDYEPAHRAFVCRATTAVTRAPPR